MIAKQTIDTLNAVYGDALDRQDYETWINLFVPDCLYLVQSRENYDRQLPLALIRLESQRMMQDRIYGCMDTIFHQIYYQRHIISGAHIVSDNGNSVISRTNYSVFRTKPTRSSEVFSVGCYYDQWVQTEHGIKLKERRCVYDSEMILNAMIYPI